MKPHRLLTATGAVALCGVVGLLPGAVAQAASTLPPQIVAKPSSVMVNGTTHLTGKHFAPDTTMSVAECGATSWVVPADPCDTTNTITVTTNAKGTFKAPMKVLTCPGTTTSPGFSEICYIGVPTPSGIDTVRLVGAATITVTGP